MAEYIEREALKKRMFSYYDCVNENTSKGNYRGENLMNYEVADMIEDCIDNAPTADVVEVVRCKDCQWWEARSCNSFIGRCENPRNGLVSEYTDDDDFCSYGERKGQE